uniref:SAP domain-containing ribonucleoprotein-like isoform X2 n=1 Tax=Solea senegalensis TaxID=28829 RepID=UPI001CD8ABBF|nr:SAP domain-containing ribonucleoprotein-like isoform X2 [Solea senegalensis]
MNNSPSRRTVIHPGKELSYREQAAKLIQDMGQQLNVYPLWRDDIYVSRPQNRAEHVKMPASTESRKATHKRAERFSMNRTSISQKVEEDGRLKKRKERCWISTSASSACKYDVEAKKMRRD